MGKTIGKIALVAGAIGVNFIPGVGQAISAALVSAGVSAAAAAALAASAITIATGAGITAAASLAGLGPSLRTPSATLERLNLTFDPNATRKIVFGETAMGTDLLYWEPSGTNQEYADYIIACAAHKVQSIDTIYTDSKVLWTVGGGVASEFSAYATVTAITEGTSANTVSINGGTNWGTTCRLTGCAYVHIRIKRSGTANAPSPFAGGLSQRLTIIGKGMPVYDARYDSTNGGTGAHRIADQTTWAFTQGGVNIGNNTACQLFTFLLGWKVGGIVSVGAGFPSARLDWADQITAANHCEEDVSVAGGGTQDRYLSAGMFGDEDAPQTVLELLCAHMQAEPRDTSGKLGVRMSYNDLSGSLLELTEHDILGPVRWEPANAVGETANKIAGRYTDATTTSLYQPAPYTERSYTSPDGLDRTQPTDFLLCQDKERAERLAEQVLQRNKWQGRLTADFSFRAMSAAVGTPVKLTFAPEGMSLKIFRIERQELKFAMTPEGLAQWCPMVLVEDDASVYTAPTPVAAPANVATVNYDGFNDPVVLATQRLGPSGEATESFIRSDGLVFDGIVANGEARDGDSVSFGATLPGVPKVVFSPGGNAATAGQNVRIKADAITVSGFTMIAKSQAVTPGTTTTDSGSSAGSGAEPDRVISKSSSDVPFDGGYRFTYSATPGSLGAGEPGNVTLGFFVKQSSVWIQVGEAVHTATVSGMVYTVYPGAVDFGAGNEFGMEIIGFEGSGSSLTFTSVAYTAGTVTETSLTPSGAGAIGWAAYR